MSRIGKMPVPIPKGVEVNLEGRELSAKGPKGALSMHVHQAVDVRVEDNVLHFAAREGVPNANALSGTMRALASNIVAGVLAGFEKKLQLEGVGYRAAAQGKKLNLTLGFSHPVDFSVPDGITVETPSATEIVIKGVDKCLVGQVAATIRAYRPPEPYKGKGVRYADEIIVRKEGKKK